MPASDATTDRDASPPDDEEVLVTKSNRSNTPDVYHELAADGTAACGRLEEGFRKPRAAVERRGLDLCQHCAGETGGNGVDPYARRRVLEALDPAEVGL